MSMKLIYAVGAVACGLFAAFGHYNWMGRAFLVAVGLGLVVAAIREREAGY